MTRHPYLSQDACGTTRLSDIQIFFDQCVEIDGAAMLANLSRSVINPANTALLIVDVPRRFAS
jgi:hypothetical protein